MKRYRISLFGMQAGAEALRLVVDVLRGVAATVDDLHCAPHAVEVAIAVPAEVDRDRLEHLLGAVLGGRDLAHLIRPLPEAPEEAPPAWRCVLLADRPLPVQALAPVLTRIAGQGLELSACRQLAAGPDRTVLALHCRGRPIDEAYLLGNLGELAGELRLDLNWLPDGPALPPRLAVFDMDSTLIDCECIDQLARRAGSGTEVAAITEAAMRGELDFAASFTRRIATLQGLAASAVDALAESVPITPGMPRLVRALQALGCHLVIASGGFGPVAERLAARYGFDEVVANHLTVHDGLLTGSHDGPIIDGAAKRATLLASAVRLGVPRSRILAVGDGANDLAMIGEAGLGVAYHAKPVVRAAAPARISHLGLDAVLYLLGYDDAQIALLAGT